MGRVDFSDCKIHVSKPTRFYSAESRGGIMYGGMLMACLEVCEWGANVSSSPPSCLLFEVTFGILAALWCQLDRNLEFSAGTVGALCSQLLPWGSGAGRAERRLAAAWAGLF